MSSFQLSRIFSTELDTPEPDSFVTDSDVALGNEIFDEWFGIPAVAAIEAILEPGCATDDIWGETRAFVSIHRLILSI
jgi:hypothetical protein